MKNIYIIPTDKQSRLFIYDGKISLSKEFQYGSYAIQNQNIYITSNEEIKPNVYALINKVLCKTELLEGKIVSRQLVGGATMDICKSEYLEIILTTDQDLIKDGVKEIDDDFLEWFVNNPSCEEVELVSSLLRVNSFDWKTDYKIIIPKDEPKQDLEKEMFELEQELDIPSHLRYHNSKPKQETLEEASEKWLNKDGFNIYNHYDTRPSFIAGVKWQMERSYSEEEVIELLLDCRSENPIDVVKWFKAI